VGPATPRARLHLPDRAALLLTPPLRSLIRQHKQQPPHSPPPRAIAGVGRSSRSSSLGLALSRPEHRLLAHLVLTSVSHEKLPFPENLSSESWPSSPECSTPWTSPLRSTSLHPFERLSTALPSRNSCAPPRALPWLESAYRRRAVPPLCHECRRAPFRAPPMPSLGAPLPPRRG